MSNMQKRKGNSLGQDSYLHRAEDQSPKSEGISKANPRRKEAEMETVYSFLYKELAGLSAASAGYHLLYPFPLRSHVRSANRIPEL